MKENKVIFVNSIINDEPKKEEYDAKRVKTQADSLIRQMKEKLNNCYDNTLSQLDIMDMTYKKNIQKTENNLKLVEESDKIVYNNSKFDNIIKDIREWRT